MTTVRRWAEQLIEGLDSAAIEQIAAHPEAALTEVFGITVVATTEFDRRGAGGWCDGVSLLDGNKILYRPTQSRRENFTLCHELGHYLAESNNDCLDWLGDLADSERVLESLCDAIAARLLIPNALRTAALADGPSAEALVQLFETTNASRSACAVAVANALPAEGFVALVDAEAPGSVFFGARTADTRPYAWAGEAIPQSHPLARLTGITTVPHVLANPRRRPAQLLHVRCNARQLEPSACSQLTTCGECLAGTSSTRARCPVGTTKPSSARAGMTGRRHGGPAMYAELRSARPARSANATVIADCCLPQCANPAR